MFLKGQIISFVSTLVPKTYGHHQSSARHYLPKLGFECEIALLRCETGSGSLGSGQILIMISVCGLLSRLSRRCFEFSCQLLFALPELDQLLSRKRAMVASGVSALWFGCG